MIPEEKDYRFVLTLETLEGEPLAGPKELPDLDTEPARECARFQSFLEEGREIPPAVLVTPRWDRDQGEPHVEGFSVVWGDRVLETPREYFEGEARQYARELLTEGVLKKGDRYRYAVTALRREDHGVRAGGMYLEVEEEAVPWRYRVGVVEEWVEEPVVCVGEEYGQAGDVPVYVPEQVLEEAEERTRENPAVETGGVLIGHLCRDETTGRTGLVVAAQIAALETVADATSLTFTARTWAAVQDALALRRDGSVMVGWWHSHPASEWCNPECPEERRAECPLKKAFFSEMDVNVHRTVFCQGYAVALVLTNTDEGIKHALYGWRGGVVRRRAFHVSGSQVAGERMGKGCGEALGATN